MTPPGTFSGNATCPLSLSRTAILSISTSISTVSEPATRRSVRRIPLVAGAWPVRSMTATSGPMSEAAMAPPDAGRPGTGSRPGT